MKKFIILMTFMAFQAGAMEKNEPEPFLWEELLPELKQTIIQEVVQSKNVSSAVRTLKKLMITSKQFITPQIVEGILDAISQQFPGNEVKIANLMNNSAAFDWLKKRKPNYNKKSASEIETRNAITYIKNNNLSKLKEWLEEGFDPTVLLQSYFGNILHNNLQDKNYTILKLLLAYGANIYSKNVVCSMDTGSGLFTFTSNKKLTMLECAKYHAENPESTIGTQKRMRLLIAFLEKELAE